MTVIPDGGGASGASRCGTLRVGLLGVWAWYPFGALVHECEFEGGFQSDDAFVQILNAELLFGHCGVELLHFIREEDGLGEGIEDASVSPMG
jgi:hypothetical protein